MADFLFLAFVIFVAFVIAISLLSIKSFFKKDGKFNGTCAQNNAALKNAVGECTVCGKVPSENCDVEISKA